MNIVDIIDKKINKKILTTEEINYVIKNFANGKIKDYQISALIIAIAMNGMTDEETIALTDAMIENSNPINFSDTNNIIVNKNSIGGVGDKVTLVLIPLLASLGIKVSKMSNKGFGYIGGTIDKLESIEGIDTNLSEGEIKKQIREIGASIYNENENISKVNKLMSDIRNTITTTESIPLIASSIMSQELATGADMLIIDIKVGNGSLIKDIDSAKTLGNLIIKLGKKYKKPTVCVLTNMSEPLGYAIGNSLELQESINTLKGNGPSDLLEIIMMMACIAIMPIKKVSLEDARTMVFNQLNNGEAYRKLKEIIRYQNGDIETLKISDNVISIKSDKSGYINKIDTLKIGKLVCELGAVRKNKEDQIDHEVGIVLSKKVGDFVSYEEELLKVYIGKKDINISEFLSIFTIEDELLIKEPVIYEIVK